MSFKGKLQMTSLQCKEQGCQASAEQHLMQNMTYTAMPINMVIGSACNVDVY